MKISDHELKKLISELSGAAEEDIHDETAFIEDLHMDSLKIVELLAVLSEEYQIPVTEEDAMGFHTYQDLREFTARQA